MEDFKEIFYFEISLIIASFIITLIALFGNTVYQMATDELQAVEDIRTARKYSAYDNKTVTGAEVIALLRENAESSTNSATNYELLQIYIDKNKSNVSLTMNEGNYTNTTWKLTSLTQSIDTGAAYTAICSNSTELLLFTGYDTPSAASYTAHSNSMVTGVKFTRI